MLKYILVVSLQYFVVLSFYPEHEPEYWPVPENTYPTTSTQSPTTCPSCISQINDECNLKTYGCNNRNCCDQLGLYCQLYNPYNPDLGGTCQCPTCQSLNQSCLAFSLGCNRNGCCPGLKCTPDKPSDIASDKGGFCRPINCPKCQQRDKRCLVYSPGCSRNECCKGLICVKTNPYVTDLGGICRPKIGGCPKCQPLNHKCRSQIANSCESNGCCGNLACVKNISMPDFPGICTRIEDVPRVVEPLQICNTDATCNLPGEPCLGKNTNTCVKNPCCETNLFHCANSTGDKPGVCQRIPIMGLSQTVNN